MTTNTKYIETVGRRKTAIARVRLTPGKESFTVNDRDFKKYFPTKELQKKAVEDISNIKPLVTHAITIKVKGGGVSAQAEAVRHGLARAIVKLDALAKPAIKKAGFLTRDPREKERRKFGLKKARKSPQWSKR